MGIARDLARALDPAVLMEDTGLVPDPWQRDFLRSTSKRQLLLCSRQSGKSTAVAALALHTALYHPPALVLLLSRALRQSQELFRKVLDAYGAIGETCPPEAESALQLELTNGSRVVSLPGKEETVRSYSGVKLLVIDEAARVPDALYYSTRPMLAVSGGRLVCLTTPWGKCGFFHQEWTEGQGWEKIKITANQCQRIPHPFLEEERCTLGDWWYKQEYRCEFVEVIDVVFSDEDITRAISSEVKPLFPESCVGGQYAERENRIPGWA
jgi:hypothetical protein